MERSEEIVAQYTRRAIITKINRELPIIIVWNYLITNKLIHPNAIKNQFILNGDITLEPIDLDDIDLEKDKNVPYYCFFHETMNQDSTNFVLPKEPSPTDKKPNYGNYYNCFACQHTKRPLGVIDFYMVMRFGVRPQLLTMFQEVQKEFYKSVEELSALMGISYNDDNREISDEEKKEQRKQFILKRTAQIYHQALKNGKSFSKDMEAFAKKSWGYLLSERGFKALAKEVKDKLDKSFYKVVDELMIGCAPNKFDSTFLYDQLKKEGFTDEELLDSKVVKYSSKNPNKIIDFHKNGIILPYTKDNRVHNIYCRQFTTDDNWRHMRLGGAVEYPVNYDKAKKFPFIIVVEGEMDYVTFKALGFENVVSVGGTKGFKPEHVNSFLYEYDRSEGERCRTIYLCLDGDEKGQDAIIAVADKVLAAGLDVRVIRMQTTDKKTGEVIKGDPNEFLQKFGLDAKDILQQLIDEAISYQAFKLVRQASTEKPSTRSEQLGFIRRNSKLIGDVDPMEKIFIAGEIAHHFGINENWLLHVWNVVPQATPKNINEFPEHILNKQWIVLFSDKAMFELCNERLPNVVYYENALEFIEAAKNHPHLDSIVLHEGLSNEYKDAIFHAFKSLKYQTFIGIDVEEVKKLEKYQFMALFRKLNNPYVNAAS